MRNLMEERVMFQLGKRTHVHIGTGHLPFTHFLDFIVHTALVHPFFPFRIALFGVFRFIEAEFRIVQLLGVLHHFGNDFFAHLLVYLGGLTGNEQLHLNGVQIFSETFFFVEQRKAGNGFGIACYPLFMLGDSNDDAHNGTLVDLDFFVLIGFQ